MTTKKKIKVAVLANMPPEDQEPNVVKASDKDAKRRAADDAQKRKAYAATLPPWTPSSKAEGWDGTWDNLSFAADSANLTDTKRIREDVDAANAYVRSATEQKKLGVHKDYNRQRARYKMGQVLLSLPELRGGDRVSGKSEQTGKVASLLPGEQVIYDAYSERERGRLRALARVPVVCFKEALLMALDREKPMSDNQANELAKKHARKKRSIVLLEAGKVAVAELKTAGELGEFKEWFNYHNCEFQKLHTKTKIPPLDAIVSDPPYDEWAVLPYDPNDPKEPKRTLFTDLGKFAGENLKPGAPMVLMVGQYWLDKIIEQVSSQGFWLRWIMTVTYKSESKIWDRQVNTKWKPILVFQRQSERDEKMKFRFISDDCVLAGTKLPDEDYFHEWQQEPETFQEILKRFCEPNSVVCDPCAGWATTGIACLRENMKFVGCEMMKDRFEIGEATVMMEEWQKIHGGRNGEKWLKELPPAVKPALPAKPDSNMYDDAETWNPFQGCGFDCSYCEPSFKRTDKRQKQNCESCYNYKPHTHDERLKTSAIPNTPIVFVCGHSDIAFCPPEYLQKIIDVVKERSAKHPEQVFYFQSKRPDCLKPFLKLLPKSAIVVTTLETNRDAGYKEICKAPPPSERFNQFLSLDYPRKVVTIEPVMDFDVKEFADMILGIKPEYVWLGYDSKPNFKRRGGLHPEPSAEKMREFMKVLIENGIEVKGKELRGLELPEAKRDQD